MAQFTTKEALKLIKLVEQNPILYNKRHDGHSSTNSEKREEVWKKIGEALEKPASACKNRWGNIRDHMRRKLKERTKPYDKRGSKYKYEDYLDFLLPFYREKVEYVDEDEPADGDGFAVKTEEIYFDNDGNEVKSETSDSLDKSDENTNNLSNNTVSTSQDHHPDPTTAFLDAIDATLRNLQPYYLNQAKSKIFQVVQELDLQQIMNKGEPPDDNVDHLII